MNSNSEQEGISGATKIPRKKGVEAGKQKKRRKKRRKSRKENDPKRVRTCETKENGREVKKKYK